MGSTIIVLPGITSEIEQTRLAEIKTLLERRHFPSILTDDDYIGIMESALHDMGRYNSMRRVTVLSTVVGQQDYAIFDATDAAGVCAGATSVIDISWNEKQSFDILGPAGAIASKVRLYPVPTEVMTVFVDYRTDITLANISGAYDDLFMQWVEYYVADTLANLYATTAGVDLLNFSDGTAALKYWQGKADKYLEKALDSQAGMQQGIVGV